VARLRAPRGGGPERDQPPRKAMIAPIQIHVTIGETIRRKVAAGGSLV
jgi:hypothetical protein